MIPSNLERVIQTNMWSCDGCVFLACKRERVCSKPKDIPSCVTVAAQSVEFIIYKEKETE